MRISTRSFMLREAAAVLRSGVMAVYSILPMPTLLLRPFQKRIQAIMSHSSILSLFILLYQISFLQEHRITVHKNLLPPASVVQQKLLGEMVRFPILTRITLIFRSQLTFTITILSLPME